MINKIFIILILFSTNANAETNWYQVTANTTLIIDWLQTKEISSNPYYYEKNPILGEKPSQSKINKYFLANILLTNIAGELLPKPFGDYLYLTVSVVEINVITKNYLLGVRVSF